MENKPYIYKITDSIINKVVYVGQHIGNNKYYEGSGLLVYRYIKKMGLGEYRKRFKKEIIEYCNIEELNKKEEYYIKQYNTYEDKQCWNLTKGGVKNLARCTVLGRHFPEKSKKLKGIKRSKKTKELMRKSKQGYKPSKLCHINSVKAVSKPVLQYSLNGVFIAEWESQKQAFNSLKLSNYDGISACCKGKQKTSGGFIWKYRTIEYPLKIPPQKRKEYKKGTSRKGKPIEINNKKYKSIMEAARSLGWSEGKLRGNIKRNKIKYRWIKENEEN